MKKKQKAFTLIELLVVIAIIGLIASIVLVNLSGSRERARIATLYVFSNGIYHSLSDNIAHFDFENDFADLAGNYELVAMPEYMTLVNDEYLGKVLMIDWDYADFQQKPHFDEKSESGALTVEGWMKPLSGGNDSLGLLGQRPWWSLELHDRDMEFSVWTSLTAGCSFSVPDAILFERWNHVVGTYDGINNIRLFINGKEYFGLVKSGGGCSGPLPGPAFGNYSMRIGNAISYGLIDGLRAYYDVLPMAQIQKHYAEGLEKYKLANK